MPDRSWALQRKLMRAPNIGFNAEVYRWFSDIDEGTPGNRLTLRNSLLIQANESRTSAIFKINYFREFVQKVHSKPSIIGIAKEDFEQSLPVELKPYITLYFQQDRAAVTPGLAPLKASISFRLMNETSTSITKTNVEALATKIKNEFALGQGYTFNKGKDIVNYIDVENGYRLRLYVINKAEGEQVVRKTLEIRNHTYDADKLSLVNPERNSLNNPSNVTILGDTYKKPRWRPTGTVRFQWAHLTLYGNPDPIYLVDRTLSRPRPIEIVY